MQLAFIKKRFSTHGGAERYLQTLLKDLKNRGHEIHIFAKAWPEEGTADQNVFFHKVEVLSVSSFLSNITFNANVKKELERAGTRPDCIISFERTTSQDIYRAGEGCHAEWLEIRSKTGSFYRKLSFKLNPLHISMLRTEKKLFANTGRIIANSKMVRDQIIKHYAVPAERITIIYNGVDLVRFSPANRGRWRDSVRKGLAMPEDSKVLLFVGSGFERKGLGTLLEAVSLLRVKGLKVLVAGKGDTKKYKKLADKYGIAGNIIFAGVKAGIEKYYAASDMFVLPTLYDPFSNATLEAMASGLPVVTTKNNGVAELVENGNEGYVLDDMADAGELADKIRLCLEKPTEMGAKARKKSEDFPIEKAAGDFVRMIEKTIKSI